MLDPSPGDSQVKVKVKVKADKVKAIQGEALLKRPKTEVMAQNPSRGPP